MTRETVEQRLKHPHITPFEREGLNAILETFHIEDRYAELRGETAPVQNEIENQIATISTLLANADLYTRLADELSILAGDTPTARKIYSDLALDYRGRASALQRTKELLSRRYGDALVIAV